MSTIPPAKWLSSLRLPARIARTFFCRAVRGIGEVPGRPTKRGGRRIRGFEVYIDGKLSAIKNKDGVLKSTFSCAAKELEVDTVDLQRAFFEAAGSEDVKGDSFPDVVTFEFKDHNIKVAKVDESDTDSE